MVDLRRRDDGDARRARARGVTEAVEAALPRGTAYVVVYADERSTCNVVSNATEEMVLRVMERAVLAIRDGDGVSL